MNQVFFYSKNLAINAARIRARFFLEKRHWSLISKLIEKNDKGNMVHMKGSMAFMKGNTGFKKGNMAFIKGNMALIKGNMAFIKGNMAFIKGNMVLMKGNMALTTRRCAMLEIAMEHCPVSGESRLFFSYMYQITLNTTFL